MNITDTATLVVTLATAGSIVSAVLLTVSRERHRRDAAPGTTE